MTTNPHNTPIGSEDRPLSVAIALPVHGQCAPETTVSLGMMMFEIGHRPPPGLRAVTIERYSSSNISHARAFLAESAWKQHGASHLLWIDSDMEFPRHALHRLLTRGEAIVGVNYTRRAAPYTPSALDLDGKCIYTAADSTGLELAGTMGFGVMLVDLRVFKDLPKPWFNQWTDPYYHTEDTQWCRLVREAGHTMWIDHELSNECRHMATIGLRCIDAAQAAEEGTS